MNYTEAVRLAQSGEERGYGFLYQNTYKSKYYLALQYMKNEEEAQDVLQEAYLRAFSNLNSLKNPELFSAWLGKIVANTAKTMLAKKNPMLFSEIGEEDSGEGIEYQIEDDRLENQPEMAYTRQETRELVHELLDSLSEEQRLCVLMFHLEGASIREIAEVLHCSENTVKSRLNYGRKNLRIKAEQLQKKGYKLYGIAPIPLLLYLLRTDAKAAAAESSFIQAGQDMASHIFSRLPLPADAGASAEAVRKAKDMADGSRRANGGISGRSAVHDGSRASGRAAAGKAASGAAKSGILHTMAGKVLIAVIGVCAVSGVAMFGAAQVSRNGHSQEEAVQEETGEEQKPKQENTDSQEKEEPQESQDSQESQESQGPVEMTDEDYVSKIAGNLTKEELELVLAYGPDEIPSQGFQDSDYALFLTTLCQGSDRNGGLIEYYGKDNGRYQYSRDDVNRMFSSFTTFQYTEDTDSDTEYGINVEGDRIIYIPATMGYTVSADITAAEYTEDEMDIYFNYERSASAGGDPGSGLLSKKAVLKPDETGMYRIVSIVEASQPVENENADQAAAQNEAEGQSEAAASMEEIYRGVLQSVQNQEPGYEFPTAAGRTEGYDYFVQDINGDGIEELIVGAEYTEQVFICHDCRVFSCVPSGNGYTLNMVSGDISVLSLFLPSDGNGLYDVWFSRGTGQTDVHRLTIENNTLVRAQSAEYQYIMGSEEEKQFQSVNQRVSWKDISDTNILG